MLSAIFWPNAFSIIITDKTGFVQLARVLANFLYGKKYSFLIFFCAMCWGSSFHIEFENRDFCSFSSKG